MTQDKGYTNESGKAQQSTDKSHAFGQFLSLRVVAGIAFGVIALWVFWMILGFFGQPDKLHVAQTEKSEPVHGVHEADVSAHHPAPSSVEHGAVHDNGGAGEHGPTPEHGAVPEHGTAPEHAAPAKHGVSDTHAVAPEHGAPHEPKAIGVHFVEATIEALDYELNQRFWGWRCNDLIKFTDNVENIQLGVLEVVRRTTVNLAERISRHGVSAAIDKNLENAMNWLMIRPSDYWLPSAEDKYNDSLKELHKYAEKLEKGEAHFYVRTDSLIPLLLSFADLTGSCDDNLVKQHEDDGSPVSWFKADDYFYYAKGVGMAMSKILHAVMEDFSDIIHTRHGHDLLHHAIHALHVASELDPWLVTDAPYDGILANHRANMAAEISHARYFLNALAKALST
ncbi:MAG: DUF2333 family protein [Proteobacteria bacterium]|nr:DUF2333 family protein [Pseudomonadota bacterium]